MPRGRLLGVRVDARRGTCAAGSVRWRSCGGPPRGRQLRHPRDRLPFGMPREASGRARERRVPKSGAPRSAGRRAPPRSGRSRSRGRLHDGDAVGVVGDELQVVGHDEHGRALVVERRAAGRAAQRRGRGPVRTWARRARAPARPPRVRCRPRAAASGRPRAGTDAGRGARQVEARSMRLDARRDLGLGHALQPQAVLELVGDRVRDELVLGVLEDEADRGEPRSRASARDGSMPSTSTVPRGGAGMTPAIACSSVVLPAPFVADDREEVAGCRRRGRRRARRPDRGGRRGAPSRSRTRDRGGRRGASRHPRVAALAAVGTLDGRRGRAGARRPPRVRPRARRG